MLYPYQMLSSECTIETSLSDTTDLSVHCQTDMLDGHVVVAGEYHTPPANGHVVTPYPTPRDTSEHHIPHYSAGVDYKSDTSGLSAAHLHVGEGFANGGATFRW